MTTEKDFLKKMINTYNKDEVDNRISNVNNSLNELKEDLGYTNVDAFGVEIDFENNIFKRIGKSFHLKGGADHNHFAPWGNMKRCSVTSTGVVDYNVDYNGAKGDVMVEIPKFYYKVEALETEPATHGEGLQLVKARYYISEVPMDGFKVHPAFVRGGAEKSVGYFSAFEGSGQLSNGTYLSNDEQTLDFTTSKMVSRSGAKPMSGLTQNLTLQNCRLLATRKGVGWDIGDFTLNSAIQMLFLVEYASFDTQSTIGLGVTTKDSGSGNESVITGATQNLGNNSGMATGTNGQVSISYRGVENFWGNIWSFVGGANIDCNGRNNAYWSNIDKSSDKISGFNKINFTLSKGNGYVDRIGYDANNDFVFLATRTTGSSIEGVNDYFWQNNGYSGYTILLLGADWYLGANAGGFYWRGTTAASVRYRNVGSRLQFFK